MSTRTKFPGTSTDAADVSADEGFLDVLVRIYDGLRARSAVVARIDARAAEIAAELERRARRRRARFDLFLREAPSAYAEDLALAVKAQQGNSAAVREIRRRLEPVVIKRIYAYSLGWNEADLVEEVFGRIFDKLALYRGLASLRTWGSHVAFSVLKNRLRELDREPKRVPIDDCGPTLPDTNQTTRADAQVEHDERDSQLKQFASTISGIACQVLTPSDWDLLQQYIVDGRRDDDVAAETGMTTNALRQRRFRALNKLRKAVLDQHGVDFLGEVREALVPA